MSDCLHACGGGGLFVQHLCNGGGPASATGTGITLRGVALFPVDIAELGSMINLRCLFLGDALIGTVNDGISSAPLDGPPGGIVCGTAMSLNILHCTTVV
eukprot:4511219-Amphidinium_carterae.1